MDNIIIWHKTKKLVNLLVPHDFDILMYPDFELEYGPHHDAYSDEELAEISASHRSLRNAELTRTDHMVEQGMNPPQGLLDYRQALRDAPEIEGWPLVTPDLEGTGVLYE
jgi:hypothetical protein